jgi:hypothetical protein
MPMCGGVSHIDPRHRAFSRAGLTGRPPARRHRGARSADRGARSARGCAAGGSAYGTPGEGCVWTARRAEDAGFPGTVDAAALDEQQPSGQDRKPCS